MKTYPFFLLIALCLFANQSIAINQGGFDYETINGNLMPTPGCRTKKEASKKAKSAYRVKKSSKMLCQQIGYGWRLSEIEDLGELVCEPCDNQVESEDNYRCYIKNVRLKCVLTRRGW